MRTKGFGCSEVLPQYLSGGTEENHLEGLCCVEQVNQRGHLELKARKLFLIHSKALDCHATKLFLEKSECANSHTKL